MEKEINFKSIRKFNLIMGALHFVQACFMLYLGLAVEKFSSFVIPVQSNFLRFDTASMRLVTDNKQIAEVPFAVCVSIFLFLSAFFHFIIAAPKFNEVYNRNLAKGMNPFRWYEYSLSSSLMIVLIALLFGVYDIGLLIALFILNASMNLFGLLMEKINQYTGKTDWTAFIFGSIAGIGPWIIVTLYTFGNVDLSKVPWFAYAIFGSYFFFFNCFPINMILQYKKVGKWKSYIYGERTYIVLSLVAKTVLAWLVFAGVMQPN
jgi:hypothetical protein